MIVRRAVPEDALAISEVRVATWRTTYRGMVPDSILDGMDVERGAENWKRSILNPDNCVFVCENERGVFGFASGGKLRDEGLDIDAEVYAIYVLKEAQGSGAGKKLMRASFDWLSERGCRSALVWVIKENPSRKFYEAMGGELLPGSKMQEIGGGATVVEEVGYVWRFLRG